MSHSPHVKRIVMSPVERTQCSWVVQNSHREEFLSDKEVKYLIRKGMSLKLCPKWSTHIIDGAHYCSQHAGVVALKILTDHTTLNEYPCRPFNTLNREHTP